MINDSNSLEWSNTDVDSMEHTTINPVSIPDTDHDLAGFVRRG